jgi:hypothetical protein
MKKCKKCGAESSDDARFCGECGTPYDVPSAPCGEEETGARENLKTQSEANETVNGTAKQPETRTAPQYVQPPYGQPYAQPQYYQPAQQYYQQPVYAPQAAYIKQPPQPVDPTDALTAAAGSGKFAVGMWFHIAAFIMTVFGVIMLASLGAGLSSAYGASQIYDSLLPSGNDNIASFLSGPMVSVLLIIACVPLVMLTTGVIVTYIGARKKSRTAVRIGMIFILIMLSLILLALAALPLLLLIAASAGTVLTSWLRAILIIWLAGEIFCILPLILAGIKALRIVNGKVFEKYTLSVVPVALIIMGVFVIMSSIGFFILLQWVEALGVICLGISCFIFASVVIGYNREAKYAVKQY